MHCLLFSAMGDIISALGAYHQGVGDISSVHWGGGGGGGGGGIQCIVKPRKEEPSL